MQVLSTQFGEMVKPRLQNLVLPPNFNLEHAVRKAIEQFEMFKTSFGSETEFEVEIYILSFQKDGSKIRNDKLAFTR